LHLLLGYQRGDYALHVRVRRYMIGPGYDAKRRVQTLASDWALLDLTEAVSATEIRPLKLAARVPERGTRLMLASYAKVRLHVMTADRDCRFVGMAFSLLAHDCRVASGSSGAPLLLMKDGVASIVGIQVTIGQHDGADIMLAVPGTSIVGDQP
jgi:protease YdgD